MEILVFGLIAMRNGYRQAQETFVREPNELQPLDVRALALLTRHSNHHEKEHETAEKNKGCHTRNIRSSCVVQADPL